MKLYLVPVRKVIFLNLHHMVLNINGTYIIANINTKPQILIRLKFLAMFSDSNLPSPSNFLFSLQ